MPNTNKDAYLCKRDLTLPACPDGCYSNNPDYCPLLNGGQGVRNRSANSAGVPTGYLFSGDIEDASPEEIEAIVNGRVGASMPVGRRFQAENPGGQGKRGSGYNDWVE